MAMSLSNKIKFATVLIGVNSHMTFMSLNIDPTRNDETAWRLIKK